MSKRSHWSYLLPIAWVVEAAGFDVASFLLRLMPIDAASWLGGATLRLLGPLSGPPQRTVDRNLRLAFPDMSASERAALSRDQWENFGRFCAEFIMVDRVMLDPGRVELVGGEHLDRIARDGGAAVFISGHFSNFEVMAAAGLRSGIECQITYRRANNPYVDKRFLATRRRYGVRYFAPKGADGSRELLEALRRGEAVALMNDQKFNQGVPSLFFGHEVHTAAGPTRLALRTTGRLQPMTAQRLKGARFRVIVHEPIVLQHTGDREADLADGVRQVNAFIEARVRERPQEWFWIHNRWSNAAYASLEG
jgi:KDO2-lipid IV(A) lauroyltransferase